jgi:hypothetical protein
MTKDKYLTLCDQMGQEPSEEKCPPDFEDFPVPVQQAIEIFNKLGDRVYPEIGYLGKNYDLLGFYIESMNIECLDVFLETLARLDSSMIKRSADQLERARNKLKK